MQIPKYVGSWIFTPCCQVTINSNANRSTSISMKYKIKCLTVCLSRGSLKRGFNNAFESYHAVGDDDTKISILT